MLLSKRILGVGNAVKRTCRKRGKGWFTPHMAAASLAVSQRIPLVDFVLEVRDARIPLSSEYHLLTNYPPSSRSRRIVVLNKMDLASPSQLKEWITYLQERNFISYAVNSHNKDSVKRFLNFLQAQVRQVRNTIDSGSSPTTTMMIVGIPNVGKSALVNSLHHIGRISAAEKGKLKHAILSPHPGETEDISSYKIASHPNIYVLDTPGILPPEILDHQICSKLALTGAIRDCLVGENKLARYFLATLNLSDEYKKWAKLSTSENDRLFNHLEVECSRDTELDAIKRRKHYSTDHTQDFIVNDVRRTLFEAISYFDGNVENEKDMDRLIDMQCTALKRSFHVSGESDEACCSKVSLKLLNLYRTGRLGCYSLESPAMQSEFSQALCTA